MIRSEPFAIPIEEKVSRLVKVETVSGTKHNNINEYLIQLNQMFPHVFMRTEREAFGKALLLVLPGLDPGLLPVMFIGHMDVVAANPADWTYPPFSGHIADRKVWGRGTLDMKGAQCALFEALDKLLQNGFTPKRTMYLYLSCDEETGGETTAYAAGILKERGVFLEAIFDEGGTVTDNIFGKIDKKCALVAIAEKGSLEYRFTAISAGGHAAMPEKNSALLRLSRLMVDCEENDQFLTKEKPAPEILQILQATMQHLTGKDRHALEAVLRGEQKDAAALSDILGPAASAYLGATIAFTVIKAGSAFNVLPKQAVLTANVRTTAEIREAEITQKLKQKAAEFDVECELVGGSDASAYSSVDSFGYASVERTIHALDKDLPVIPTLLFGGTDSKHFQELTQTIIRFSPIFISKEQSKGVHGSNEYITVESLEKAVAFYTRLLFEEI